MSSQEYFILIAVFLVLGLLYKFARRSGSRSNSIYVAKIYIMTRTEHMFHKWLKTVIRREYEIFAQVRIADVISVKQMKDKKKWWFYFRKISQKHVDFVIAHKTDGKIVACIELDDSSHDKKERKIRDNLINNTFEQCGTRLLRIPAKRSYSKIILGDLAK